MDGSVVSTYAEGGNALLRCLDQSVKPEILDSNISLLESLVPSKICRFRRQQSAPVGFETLIVPFKGPDAPSFKTEHLSLDSECADADAVCIKVTTDAGSDLILISSAPGNELSFDGGKLKSDAAAAVIRMDKQGKVIFTYQTEGSTTYNGKSL